MCASHTSLVEHTVLAPDFVKERNCCICILCWRRIALLNCCIFVNRHLVKDICCVCRSWVSLGHCTEETLLGWSNLPQSHHLLEAGSSLLPGSSPCLPHSKQAYWQVALLKHWLAASSHIQYIFTSGTLAPAAIWAFQIGPTCACK